MDNSAEKPKDWDDAAQGTWQPPLLKNPLYRVWRHFFLFFEVNFEELGGHLDSHKPRTFGLFQGEWRPRKIPNPNYKGIWPHPQIANPEYVPDPSLSVYENISVIGLDLWQVSWASSWFVS